MRLSFTTDETIIGGLVARIGSTIFDGSVQSQLERLADESGRSLSFCELRKLFRGNHGTN